MLPLRMSQRINHIVDVVRTEGLAVPVGLKSAPLDQNHQAVDIFLLASDRAPIAAAIGPRMLVGCDSRAAAAADGVVLDTDPSYHARRPLRQQHLTSLFAPRALADRECHCSHDRRTDSQQEP